MNADLGLRILKFLNPMLHALCSLLLHNGLLTTDN